MTFIKANIEPTNRSLETILSILYSIENVTIRIREENSSTNKREIKHLSQDLKIKDVELLESVKNAKGERSINTFIKMYLTENIKIKLRKPIDSIVFIIPSIENIFEKVSSVYIIASDISISLEKQISKLYKLLPTSLMELEIKLLIVTICSHKKKLEFIQIPIIIIFIIN